MKRLFFSLIAVCLSFVVKAQIHTGVYTHGSIGRSNTGQTITVDKQLLNVEFYDDYIKVNGSIARFGNETVLSSATPSITFRPGQRVKFYTQKVDGMTVSYIVDSNYNMEALWVYKQNGILLYYFFPIEKGNTLSTSSSGGFSGGSYSGGGYGGGSYGGGYSGNGSTGSSTSGSTPRQLTTKTCGVCHGTGTCNICGGDGWVTVMGIGKDHYCVVCRNHDGRCSSCNGRGTWKE